MAHARAERAQAVSGGSKMAEAAALVYASFATLAVYRRTMRESSAAPDSPAGTDAGTTPGTEGAHDPF